jgi:hypothetical protein
MDRTAAFTLADELITAISPDDAGKLRPVLAEVFEGIQSTGPRLIKRRGGQPLTAYLLDPGLFIVRAYPGSTDLDVHWINLTDATVTRRCHDIRETQSGIWWQTTWRVQSGDLEEDFLGDEGPPHAVDNEGAFGRAVAKAAGWPIVGLCSAE